MKIIKWLEKLNLQLFEGDGAAAGTGAGDGDAGEATVVTAEDDAPINPKRKKRNPLADVKYGKQQSDPQPEPEQEAGNPDQVPDRKAEWERLKKEYAQEYGADVQSTIQQRFKNQKDQTEELNGLRNGIAPMMQQLAKRFGMENADDYNAIAARFMDDDSVYEEEAMERGLPVETVKQLHQLQADHDRLAAMQQQSFEQQRFEAHIQNLVAQGERLKQTYPGFDLRTELQNPEFQRLTSPNVGVDVETAYWIMHRNELQPMAMQAGVQIAERKLANSMQSHKNRPAENGIRRSAAIDIRDDPSKWSRADRLEVRDRVRRGERIEL